MRNFILNSNEEELFKELAELSKKTKVKPKLVNISYSYQLIKSKK